MSFQEFLSGLKSWQQGAAAILAFGGLIIAALFNAHLNRRHDERLRQEEVRSVTAALYAEMCVLRSRAGKIAKNVAAVHIARGTTRTTLTFDKHFVRANTLPEQPPYKALASKFGLLPPSLIIPITNFYENINLIETWLPQIADDPDRGFGYSVLYVLTPALDAVTKVVPALHEIENLISAPDAERVKTLDLGKAEQLAAFEEDQDRDSE